MLTNADVAVQRLILKSLSEFERDPRVIAEESDLAMSRSTGWTGRVWVVDPIDGTAEFVKLEAASSPPSSVCWLMAYPRLRSPSHRSLVETAPQFPTSR